MLVGAGHGVARMEAPAQGAPRWWLGAGQAQTPHWGMGAPKAQSLPFALKAGSASRHGVSDSGARGQSLW